MSEKLILASLKMTHWQEP